MPELPDVEVYRRYFGDTVGHAPQNAQPLQEMLN
jgi:hypothetical protein